ncbi:hypothetical protein GGR54DRAFT_639761 [Hypoxylon sp. NC1633]|nr:hypothetical protein GGR54DRAFT_639761 [Hypoxylon sp. NC1633]
MASSTAASHMSTTETEAKLHVNAIRRGKGANGTTPQATAHFVASLTEETAITWDQILRCQTMQFILEFIQQAEDATAVGEGPKELRFKLHARGLQIDFTGMKLVSKDIDALSGVALAPEPIVPGEPTKHNRKVMGIGIKSVFKIATAIHIYSPPYCIKFDTKENWGMICPVWTENYLMAGEFHASFYIELHKQCDMSALTSVLRALDYKILIFSSTIARITVDISIRNAMVLDYAVTKSLTDVETVPSIVSIRRNGKLEEFLFSSRDVNLDGRLTRISLAFPLDGNRQPLLRPQSVYSDLPVKDYGFLFLLNTDFITSADRRSIADIPWNNKLLRSCVQVIGDSFVDLARRSPIDGIRWTWMRFMRHGPRDELFRGHWNSVLDHLSRLTFLQTEVGTRVSPLNAVYCESRFRDRNGKLMHVRPETSNTYLSTSYLAHDCRIIEVLGVERASPLDILRGLEWLLKSRYRTEAQRQEDYIEDLAKAILPSVHDQECKKLMQKIPIIAISGEGFVAADDEDIYMSLDDDVELPGGLGGKIVDQRFARHTPIRRLYICLGGKQLNRSAVCDMIINMHTDPKFNPGKQKADDLIDHALYLYQSDFEHKAVASQIFILATNGKRVRAMHAHQPYQGPGTELKHAAARYYQKHGLGYFLDDRYLRLHKDKDVFDRIVFANWLREHMDIYPIPRLVTTEPDGRFKLTPEFRTLMNGGTGLSSADILVLLRDNWSAFYSVHFLYASYDRDPRAEAINTCVANLMEELSGMQVDCLGGSKAPLRDTSFVLSEWENREGRLSVLDIPDPMDPRWEPFLETFGIDVRGSISRYMKHLEEREI